MEGAGGMFDGVEFARFNNFIKGISLFYVFNDGVGKSVRIVKVFEIFAFRDGSYWQAE